MFYFLDKYKYMSIFDQTENKRSSRNVKVNPRIKKYTYLDDIERNSKVNKKPSVGKYNL